MSSRMEVYDMHARRIAVNAPAKETCWTCYGMRTLFVAGAAWVIWFWAKVAMAALSLAVALFTSALAYTPPAGCEAYRGAEIAACVGERP